MFTRLSTILILLLCTWTRAEAPKSDVLLYAPFDDGAKASIARGNGEPQVTGTIILRKGLMGNAIVLGKNGAGLTFDGSSNIDASRGSAAFWVMPIDWTSDGSESHPFFRIGGDEGHLAYIYKYFAPHVLNFYAWVLPDEEHGTSYFMPLKHERGDLVKFNKGEWKHIAFTWFDDQLRVYLDGALRKHWPMHVPLDAGSLGKTIGIGASHDPYSTLMDELYVFHHPLSDGEVAELYNAGRAGRKPHIKTDVKYRVYLKYFPGVGFLEMFADAAEAHGATAPDSVQLALLKEKLDRPLVRARADAFENAMARTLVKLPKLQAGLYFVTAQFFDKEGKPLGDARSEPLDVRHYPWMDEKVGVGEDVITPWTPLKKKDNKIECWGREYEFDNTGLLHRIRSNGGELLSAPIRLIATVNGQKKEWLAPGALRALKQKPGVILLQGKATAGKLAMTSDVKVEFDGVVDYVLQVKPDEECDVDELRLEIPIKQDHAALLHYVGDNIRWTCYAGRTPADSGRLWTSASVKAFNPGVQGSFIPYIWLGDEDRGLCWFADTTRGWNPGERGESELYREGNVVRLVINFVGTRTRFKDQRQFKFGLMATPVKPVESGWRLFYSPILQPYAIRTITHGCTFQGYGKPTDEKLFREAAENHRRLSPGCCIEPAMGPNDLWGGEENLYFINDWDSRVKKGMATPLRNDFQMWHFRRVVRDYGIDGAYSDDTFPIPVLNPVGTSAWVDEKGVRHVGYNIAAIRDFHRRIAYILRGCKGRGKLTVHMSDAMVAPCFSFADFALDGEFAFENAARTCGTPFEEERCSEYDYLDLWRLDAIRARAMGRQWGVIPIWLPTGSPEESWGHGSEMPKVHRSLLTITLLHDMLLYWNHRIDHDEVAKVDEVKKEFGIGESDVTFHGYWEDTIRTSTDDVLVSYWQRPDKVLMVLGNVSRKDATVTVQMDNTSMGLDREISAIHGINRDAVEVRDGKFRITVPYHEFRLVLMGKKGSLVPGRPHPGEALPKPREILTEFSDDFDSPELSAVWKVDRSPKSHGVVKTQDGKLKLRSALFTYCHAERDFGLDDVSVQCRIDDRIGGNFDVWRPCMALYWGKGSYARAMASCQFNTLRFKFLVMANGRAVWEEKEGPPINSEGWYTKNWVKIALRPDAIKFFCSSDGKKWQGPWVSERPKALSGPPKLLILGKGHETGQPPYDGTDFDNDWERGTWGSADCCYFDDLIVGRED